MIVYRCPQFNMLWYEVPKVGCSSLKVFCEKNDYAYNSVKLKHLHRHRKHFQFAFVRNPWDRLVSCFVDKTKRCIGTPWQLPGYVKYKNHSFTEFVHAIKNDDFSNCERHCRLQYNLINHDYVNFIGRFENFQTDFEYVCNQVGITPQCNLPHWNKTEHKYYTEYYDDETREIVAEKYAKDIEYFGYEFYKSV